MNWESTETAYRRWKRRQRIFLIVLFPLVVVIQGFYAWQDRWYGE